MLRVAAGDDAAFEELVGRVLPRLLGYFRRLGADRTFAEDCAQEVFVKVYRARAGYVARARFMTYLFHVARNYWIDVYRHRKSQPPPLSADQLREPGEGGSLLAELAASADTPDAGVRGAEAGAALSRAIERLPAEQREVFVLAQVEGLKYQDIGRILEIPVGTVKSRMHAAVRGLRGALRREGFEPT
ncbi:MAG: sigma-70 family RNA polymerase sigma factor [Planctomycetota bacterium]|nr:sigma-70 family RNA polymerase sigma factor [Planctomycetota bacterium]